MLRKVNVLVTGPPGCGKSTLINNLVERLRVCGFKVGGITTPDIRSTTGQRTGFHICDIATGDKQTMASIGFQSEVSVGRYGVNVEAIRTLGVFAINRAIGQADIVVIDEIGKMELIVPEFQRCVIEALDSTKPVLGTIGLHLKSDFITEVKQHPKMTIVKLDRTHQAVVFQHTCELLGLTNKRTQGKG